jgi:hypothetical protein
LLLRKNNSKITKLSTLNFYTMYQSIQKTTQNVLIITLLCFFFSACDKPEQDISPSAEEQESSPKTIGDPNLPEGKFQYFNTSSWAPGNLSTNQIINPDNLKPMTIQLGGGRKWVSNNPEVFRGDGWLMQNAGRTGRGGRAFPISGWNGIYLFHINKSGSTKYLHVLVTNPNSANITAYAVGSMFTNSQFPLNGSGTGPCYMVARNWLTGNHSITTPSVTIAPFRAYQIARITMHNNNMVDGRFELHTSGGAYVYTVITSSGNLNDAINLSQGGPANGDLAYAGPNTYGREAGVYSNHNVIAAVQTDLPTTRSHIGFCLNTTAKFNSKLQEQTAPSNMILTGASPRTYGNYGHRFNITMDLRNTSSATRRVRVSFASNVTSGNLSLTYNGPFNYNGSLRNIFTTPSAPKQVLGEFNVSANSTKRETITFFVPGLITTNHQLIVETL